MKKKLVHIYLMCAFLLATGAGQASALTFYLDQVMGSPVTPTPSYGTISLSQFDRGVQIDVALNDTSMKLQQFALNYDDDRFGNNDTFYLTYKNPLVKEDKVGYHNVLDLQIPETGNLEVSSYSAVLYHSDPSITLTPEDFNFIDERYRMYTIAHIGSIGDNETSIWVGSDGKEPTSPVPEPGSMMLLGAGFLGLAVYGKRSRNA